MVIFPSLTPLELHLLSILRYLGPISHIYNKLELFSRILKIKYQIKYLGYLVSVVQPTRCSSLFCKIIIFFILIIFSFKEWEFFQGISRSLFFRINKWKWIDALKIKRYLKVLLLM